MFFTHTAFLKGAVMSAEDVRRSLAGSILMACFIDTASGYLENIPARLETLRYFNTVLEVLLNAMSPSQLCFISPYLDLRDGID